MYRLRCWLDSLFLGVFIFLQPIFVFAAGQEEEEPPEWVMAYFLVLLFLGLAILILLRPSMRRDSALTQDEIDTEKIEAARKKRGH